MRLDYMSEDPKPNSRGRPPKYSKKKARLAREYCTEHGSTDRELAAFLGIVVSTLYAWKLKYSDFSDAIQEGRKNWQMNGCQDIVQSLYQKARGYEYTEKQVTQRKRGDKVVETITKATVKRIHPDRAAAEFILINRDPIRWKSVNDNNDEITNEKGGVLLIGTRPDEEEWLDQAKQLREEQQKQMESM